MIKLMIGNYTDFGTGSEGITQVLGQGRFLI